jgi:serine/threonine protein kinase
MPDPEDSLGGETFSGEEQQDPAEQSLGGGATMGGDTAAHSLGDQSTFGDANVDDELFDDGMEIVDLSIRYTEEGVLGKGGFGEVILATDARLGRKVAIKRIQGKAARSKTAVQRFLTEAKSIAALSHNNIVQIYDYGRSTDGPFLIMECVQGGSLLDQCRKGPIELDEAVKIFSQVCDGLAKAHAENIIHRDIKPANILMTGDGIPKLTDFGLAKDDTADTGMTMEGAVIGTLDFMPPEQRRGAEFTDHRSDLWSLAATFYQMLTGKSPKVINISGLPPRLQSVVAKALEESKDERFQSAMEMREAILQAHSGKMDKSRSLGEGECPQCATANPSGNKYCDECGASLQVKCLNCESDIAIWNKACRECGAQQTPLVDKALADLKEIHDEAESLLADLNFDAAVEKYEVIANLKDSRLQQYKSWHEEFSTRLESSRKSEYGRLGELLQEAATHENAYDYKSGLQTLSQVAPPLKDKKIHGSNDTAGELTNRLTTKQSQLMELEVLVRERVSKREITGLLSVVTELLALKPDRPEVQKLEAKLRKREAQLDTRLEQIVSQAQSHMFQQQWDAAWQILSTIAPEHQTSNTLRLSKEAAAEIDAASKEQTSVQPTPVAPFADPGYAPQRGGTAYGARVEALFKWYWIHLIWGFSTSCILVGFVGLIASVVYQLMLIYELWSLIPRKRAATTPGKAIGFLFIPVFNAYWIFVAFHGLAKALNNEVRSVAPNKQVSEGLSLTFCILILIGIIPYVGIISSLAGVVIGVILMKQLATAGAAIANSKGG